MTNFLCGNRLKMAGEQKMNDHYTNNMVPIWLGMPQDNRELWASGMQTDC